MRIRAVAVQHTPVEKDTAVHTLVEQGTKVVEMDIDCLPHIEILRSAFSPIDTTTK